MSTFVNPELTSWKCYPPPSLYLPSWNQRLPVSCYAHLCELGHVLQSASCTKENTPDPCPGARVIARNSWKYPHCTELKCLQGDMWQERPYFQSMVITGVVVVDHLFIPKSILHLTSEMYWLGSYYTEAVCANPAKYFRKKSQIGVWISKHKKVLAWGRTENKLEFKMTQPDEYKKWKMDFCEVPTSFLPIADRIFPLKMLKGHV